MAEYVNPFPGQELMLADLTHDYTEPEFFGERAVAEIENANIVNSVIDGSWPDPENRWPERGRHKILLDVDFPVTVLESSTPGHHHLYIDHEMSWLDYERLLEVLAELGVIQAGYLGAAKKRGYTSVRLPWIKKVAP